MSGAHQDLAEFSRRLSSADFAAQIGYEAGSVGLDENQQFYFDDRWHNNALAAEVSHKGKVSYRAVWKETDGGVRFPHVRFSTFKHGGVTATYRGYDDVVALFERGHIAKPSAPPTPPKTEPTIDPQEAIRRERQLWDGLSETGESAYLNRKQVGGFGVRYGSDNGGRFVAVPMSAASGDVHGFQRIYNDAKKYSYGVPKNGLRHILPGSGDTTYIVSGYATAASVHEATGATVVVCFDDGNYQHVIGDYPNAVLVADNDQWKDCQNSGLTTCAELSVKYGLSVALPDFAGLDTSGKPTDFNDLHCLAGLDTVREQLERARVYKPLPSKVATLSRAIRWLEEAPSVNRAQVVLSRFVRQSPKMCGFDELVARITDALPDKHRKPFADKATRQYQARKRRAVDTVQGIAVTNLADIVLPAKGVVLVKAPQGVGKTISIGKPVVASANRALVLGHRQTLMRDLSRRLGIACYLDDGAHYRPKIALCIHSLLNSKYEEHRLYPDVVFIDEVAQVLRAIASGDKMDDPQGIYDALVKVVKNARLVVAVDADTDQQTLDFFAGIRDDVTTYVMAEDSSHLAVKCGTEKTVELAFVADMQAGECCLVSSHSKDEAGRLAARIASSAPAARVLLVTDNTKRQADVLRFLGNPGRECLNYDCVIHSPTISSGVSIETEHFTRHYVFSYDVLTPADTVQMMRRDRTAREFTVAFCGRLQNRPTKADELKTGILEDNLKQRGYTEIGNQIVMDWTPFDDFRVAAKARENELRNDSHSNLIFLLEHRGYQVERLPDTNSPALPSLSKEHRERLRSGIQSALDIDAATNADMLRSKEPLSQAQTMALKRFDCKELLALDTLSDDDIAEYVTGQLHGRIAQAERLFNPLAWAREQDAKEADVALSLKTFFEARRDLAHTILTAASLCIETGRGIITETTARAALSLLQPHKARFASQFNITLPKALERPVQWFSNLLGRFGLTLECVSQLGKRGDRARQYRINPDSWRRMRDIVKRRLESVHSNQNDCLTNINRLLCTKPPEKDYTGSWGGRDALFAARPWIHPPPPP